MQDLNVWEVELFINVGTIDEPVMEWVKDKRFYRGEKKATDFDLHDIEGKRRNAKFLYTQSEAPKTSQS